MCTVISIFFNKTLLFYYPIEEYCYKEKLHIYH